MRGFQPDQLNQRIPEAAQVYEERICRGSHEIHFACLCSFSLFHESFLTQPTSQVLVVQHLQWPTLPRVGVQSSRRSSQPQSLNEYQGLEILFPRSFCSVPGLMDFTCVNIWLHVLICLATACKSGLELQKVLPEPSHCDPNQVPFPEVSIIFLPLKHSS